MDILSISLGGLLIGACLVCTAPVLAQNISAAGIIGPHYVLNDSEPMPMDPLPICDCPENPMTQIFMKDYADVYSAACDQIDHDKRWRQGTATHIKHICRNGAYWTCTDSDYSSCAAFLARPTCPQDSCVH